MTALSKCTSAQVKSLMEEMMKECKIKKKEMRHQGEKTEEKQEKRNISSNSSSNNSSIIISSSRLKNNKWEGTEE
jgi:hypothetical protein